MNPENDDEAVKRVLLAAHARGFTVHEETRVPCMLRLSLSNESPLETRESRFTFILPHGQLVSIAQWYGRREALKLACRALEPWLEKFEVKTPQLKN
jgi:hypothetical protein